MTQSSRSHYGFIDAIRGVAACAVLLQHSLYYSGLLGVGANLHLREFIPNWLELGETGVVAFFIVSGFVIPLSLEKTANFGLFWIHRALRIYPLYLVVFIFTIIMLRGGNIHTPSDLFVNVLANLLFIQEYVKQQNFVAGSWTLSLEIFWYLAISGLVVLSLDKKNISLVVIGLLISLAADAACAHGYHLPVGRLSMLLCCVLGLICYRRATDQISGKTFAILSGALICGIGLNLFLGFYLFPGPHPSATFRMAACSWSLAALIFFAPFLTRGSAIWGHPVFSFMGRHSYSIYLLHPIVISILEAAGFAGVALIVITFALTIGMSILTYRLIESPPVRLGHRLRRDTWIATTSPHGVEAAQNGPDTAGVFLRREYARRMGAVKDRGGMADGYSGPGLHARLPR